MKKRAKVDFFKLKMKDGKWHIFRREISEAYIDTKELVYLESEEEADKLVEEMNKGEN